MDARYFLLAIGIAWAISELVGYLRKRRKGEEAWEASQAAKEDVIDSIHLSPEEEDLIRQLKREGRRVEAIKQVSEFAGVDLKTAKRYVSRLRMHGGNSAP
ncbi:MAG: hypothetical protein Q4E76_06355 [Tissierellia bacterium]|nr:hypothetical protein [Tissierellia bacterium]